MVESEEERQRLLDYVFRRVRSGLKESELAPDAIKTATDVVRQVLQEVATNTPHSQRRTTKQPSTAAPLKVLHQFWKLDSVIPYTRSKDPSIADEYRKFDFNGSNQGTCVVYCIRCRINLVPSDASDNAPKGAVGSTVYHRYKEFDKLRQDLLKQFRYRLFDTKSAETHRVNVLLVPALPPKSSLALSSKYDPRFVAQRCQALTCWLEYLCRHNILQLATPFLQFMLPGATEEDSTFRKELETRASQFLSSMRRDYASAKAVAVSLSSTTQTLRERLERSVQAMKQCSQVQMNLNLSREGLSEQLVRTAAVEDQFARNRELTRTTGLSAVASMLRTIMTHAVCPLETSLFEPLQEVFTLFANQVLVGVRKLLSDTPGLKKIEVRETEPDLEAERAAVECIEADKVRKLMIASRLENLVQGHIDSSNACIEAYTRLAQDIAALDYNEVSDFLEIEKKYRDLAVKMNDRTGSCPLTEAVQTLIADPISESLDIGLVDNGLDNSILQPATPVFPKSGRIDSTESTEPELAQPFARRLRSSETKRRSPPPQTSTHSSQDVTGTTTSGRREPYKAGETNRGLSTQDKQKQAKSDVANPGEKTLANNIGKSVSSPSLETLTRPVEGRGSAKAQSPSALEGEGGAIHPPLDNWRTAEDSDGHVYYYHTKTRVTRWEKPNEVVQAKIEERALESEKRQKCRLDEVRRQRIASEEQEEAEREISKEVAIEIERWKTKARCNAQALDLAGLLTSLPTVLDVEQFRISEIYNEQSLSTKQLRRHSKDLRKLYRSVIKRVHPDKIGPDVSLADSIRCREVFKTLGDYANFD